METVVRTPLDIFALPQHLEVPLFQRPYVWEEDEQWQPLWGDVRRMAELRLADPTSQATHFLGAVVLQSQENLAGSLTTRLVIDGQQRLTTLQLLMDATGAVLESAGIDHLSQQLHGLTHNPQHFVSEDAPTLKLRHANRDRAAYDEVMNAEPPIAYESLTHGTSRIALAHAFFSRQVEAWLGDETSVEYAARAQTLTAVLSQALQLVVIQLTVTENSQEIFETLNARGTPLTAADLVRNYVFQRLQTEGVNVQKHYEDRWPFESKFWEAGVSVGRFSITRSSLFLNQWLISRTGEEIGPTATFTRFKHFAEHDWPGTMSGLLEVLHQQARRYEQWTSRAAEKAADLSPVELCVYRMASAQLELLKPLLIWLHEPGLDFSHDEIDRVVQMTESWVMRRSLMRLPTGDLGRIVAELIATNRLSTRGDVAGSLERQLRSLNVASTYWPGDDELRRSIRSERAYQRFRRPRLRMFLEAVEDHYRGFTSAHPKAGHRVPREGFHIEHLLPQRWRTHWPVEGLAAEVDRNDHVHRLGNLTLLTGSLNTSVSNGPWFGPKGKRESIDNHDVFLLNRRVYESSADGWDETHIDERTEAMLDALIATWPVPDGHLGAVAADAKADTTSISVRHLVAAGLLPEGSQLVARSGTWGQVTARVLADGSLDVAGTSYATPSAAGFAVRGGSTNGWKFWRLPDGRPLDVLRAELAADDNGSGSAG